MYYLGFYSLFYIISFECGLIIVLKGKLVFLLSDSLHLLHGSVVADHDYVGMPELPVGAYQASILVEDAAIGVDDSELLTSSKDRELLEYRNAKISPLMEDHNALEKQTFSLLDSSNQVLEYLT